MRLRGTEQQIIIIINIKVGVLFIVCIRMMHAATKSHVIKIIIIVILAKTNINTGFP